ncbi:tetratricopeptide repeat protein [Bacteroides hominis]|uniref:tetratricopeptide repeat protein n=1 Tax=Bacteroides hominis TaxID=2763023 RepID=UPI002948F944|nr:tetratricopeptide repeat protein [Bacteroides hominis (ex Liu et al. 2022)]MDV6186327.1 tetratricopeptide repeat protein [Bacteroides hominis (ex Liu et al. 2022)]
MKRVLFSMVLLMAVSFAFAQEKNVKEAKSIAGEVKPDFAKAEQLINEALTNPETKDNAATWDVAGYIQKRINEKEMENAYLRKPYDTLKVYNSVLNMYNYFIKCDELAQIPNEKGKIKNKYRSANSKTILAERPNLINGGIQYFNLNQNEEALKFFAAYVDAATLPMLEKENLLEKDTILPQVAYYATLAADRVGDKDAVMKYAQYALKDKENGQFAMQLLTDAYKAKGDTAKWVEKLQEGIVKFPENQYFFANLVDYYSSSNQNDKAMQFANDMLAKDPNNKLYLYVKAYLYHNMKDYEKAIEFYKKTLDVDPTYAEACSNLGLVYLLQAQDYADKAPTDINDPNYATAQANIKKFYEEAKPYYEKARELKPDQKDLWLQGLYRVYYNLNMGPEFEAIEKLMN